MLGLHMSHNLTIAPVIRFFVSGGTARYEASGVNTPPRVYHIFGMTEALFVSSTARRTESIMIISSLSVPEPFFTPVTLHAVLIHGAIDGDCVFTGVNFDVEILDNIFVFYLLKCPLDTTL